MVTAVGIELNLSKITWPVAAIKSLRFALFKSNRLCQFWPLGIVVACICLSVCLSIRHGNNLLVRAITCRPIFSEFVFLNFPRYVFFTFSLDNFF